MAAEPLPAQVTSATLASVNVSQGAFGIRDELRRHRGRAVTIDRKYSGQDSNEGGNSWTPATGQ